MTKEQRNYGCKEKRQKQNNKECLSIDLNRFSFIHLVSL